MVLPLIPLLSMAVHTTVLPMGPMGSSVVSTLTRMYASLFIACSLV